MTFEWAPDLAVGIEEMDRRNVEWFTRTNRLLAAIAGGSRDDIAAALGSVEDYVNVHLALEESIMQEHDFPGLIAHQLEHRELQQEIVGLKWSMVTSRSTAILIDRMQAAMCPWLLRHIRTHDKGLCAFLKQKGVEVRKLAA